jgi:hypothetical protein
MKTPTWRVILWAPVYASGRGHAREAVVRAHTGVAAEAAALKKHPGCEIVGCVRLTGYEEERSS